MQRHASTIKLCKVGSSGHMKELWACLRFTSYERSYIGIIISVARVDQVAGLTLFYCAFLALRSEDAGNPIGSFDDHEIHGEKSIYAG